MKTSGPADIIHRLLASKERKPIWLAEKIGTSRAHLSRMLNGKSPFTMEWILKISRALNVKPYELAGVLIDKKTAKKIDDVAMGSIIGWLMEFSTEAKVKLSQAELNKLTKYIYTQSTDVPLNFQDTRYLAFSSIQIKKLLKH